MPWLSSSRGFDGASVRRTRRRDVAARDARRVTLVTVPGARYRRTMLTGAHVIVFGQDAEAARTFLRDVLELPAVDAGGGWLILGLPPAEVAVHPADGPALHELFLMCDDVH